MRVADYASAATAIEPTVTGKTRAVGPDLFRALAILMVMLWHLPTAARAGALADLHTWGWLGVDMFFVLSGYLIGSQLMTRMARGQGIDFADFYLRRAFRILPAYLAVLALYLLIPTMHEHAGMQPAWRFLTFTMNLDLNPSVTGTFSSAWSLCVEEHFYLVTPLILLALRGRARWLGPLIVVGVLAFGMALRWTQWSRYAALPEPNWQLFMQWIYYPTWCRMDGLLLGVCLAAARTFRPQLVGRWLPGWAALVAGLGVLAVSVLVLGDQGVQLDHVGATFGYPLFCLACALLLSASIDADPWLARIPLPGLAGLATLSYSLYLVHKAVYKLDDNWLAAKALSGWPAFALYACTVLVAALALHFVVERPFLKLRDRVLARRSAA